MDLLNTWESVEHHYRAYGGWSWVLQDYLQEGFATMFRKPEAKLLAEIEDPLSYFDRYVGMPKVSSRTLARTRTLTKFPSSTVPWMHFFPTRSP